MLELKVSYVHVLLPRLVLDRKRHGAESFELSRLGSVQSHLAAHGTVAVIDSQLVQGVSLAEGVPELALMMFDQRIAL